MGDHGLKVWEFSSTIGSLRVELFFDRVAFHGIRSFSTPVRLPDGTVGEISSGGLSREECGALAALLRSPRPEGSISASEGDEGDEVRVFDTGGGDRKLVFAGDRAHLEVELHRCDRFLLAALLEEAVAYGREDRETRATGKTAEVEAS